MLTGVRVDLVKKILTRFAVAKKSGASGESVYRSPRIYLPTKLTDDSSFPFKEGDIISVRVDGRRLLVQRVRKPPDETILRERSHNSGAKPSKSSL